MINLQSSAQAEGPSTGFLHPGPGELEKRGRIGRVKERKEGSGERSIKSLIPYPVGALWPVVCVRRRPGTKGSQLRPLGLVHWQASWPLSTPSGQDVSLSEEESRLVSGLSLAIILTRSPSWWCTPCSAKMDVREKDSGRWSDMCLLLIFPEFFRLVVA